MPVPGSRARRSAAGRRTPAPTLPWAGRLRPPTWRRWPPATPRRAQRPLAARPAEFRAGAPGPPRRYLANGRACVPGQRPYGPSTSRARRAPRPRARSRAATGHDRAGSRRAERRRSAGVRGPARRSRVRDPPRTDGEVGPIAMAVAQGCEDAPCGEQVGVGCRARYEEAAMHPGPRPAAQQGHHLRRAQPDGLGITTTQHPSPVGGQGPCPCPCEQEPGWVARSDGVPDRGGHAQSVLPRTPWAAVVHRSCGHPQGAARNPAGQRSAVGLPLSHS